MQAGGTQPPLPPSNPSEARPPPPPDAPPPQIVKKVNDGHYVPGSQDNQSNKRNQQVYPLGDGADYLKFQNLLYHNTVSANMQMQQLMTAKNQYANDSQNPGRSQNSYNSKKGKNIATNDYNTQWNEDGTLKVDPQQSMNAWYAHSQAAAALQYQTANSAISEEERQFDIQFKKWEEEFQAWKQQNINHPDKAAYQEYEKKFQACRAQLMERKEQMKTKRISALITQKPPALPDNLRNSTNMPYYQSNQNYAAKPSLMGSVDKNMHSYDPNMYKGDSSTSYMQDTSSLFSKPPNMKGIPGLDLVDDYTRRNANEIVDITADDMPTSSKKPDLKAISKGINNILGDQKLLNMLSFVTQQKNDGTSGKESKRSGSRWVDDVPSASTNHSQTKYTITGAPQQYSYPEETVQSYGETSYSTSQLPSLLDPLPFNTSYYQNAANTSQSNDKYSGMDSRHRMDESSMPYEDPSMYNAEMYQRGEEYGNNYYGNVDDSAYNADDNQQNDIGPSAKPAWMDYPILEPLAIVDYQHEPIKPCKSHY